MARIYPTPIGRCDSLAEQRLYGLLRDQLDDRFVVFHNVAWLSKTTHRPPVDGEADFVIAHPDLGVMVIEVKGGRILHDGSRDVWTSIDGSGIPHEIADPFAQARREMYGLRNVAGEMPEWPSSSVRFARAVAFPDVMYTHIRTPDGPRRL